MFMRDACAAVVALSVLCCREESSRPVSRAPTASSPHVLPDIPGFVSGAEEGGPAYTRRTYARGPDRTTVTLAHLPMSAPQYEDWLRMSRADFPQANLEVAPTEGNGFYQCAPEDPSRCNLLVQLRCGLHLEIRGQGVARRTDADAVLQGLALPRLAKSCDAGGKQ